MSPNRPEFKPSGYLRSLRDRQRRLERNRSMASMANPRTLRRIAVATLTADVREQDERRKWAKAHGADEPTERAA